MVTNICMGTFSSQRKCKLWNGIKRDIFWLIFWDVIIIRFWKCGSSSKCTNDSFSFVFTSFDLVFVFLVPPVYWYDAAWMRFPSNRMFSKKQPTKQLAAQLAVRSASHVRVLSKTLPTNRSKNQYWVVMSTSIFCKRLHW